MNVKPAVIIEKDDKAFVEKEAYPSRFLIILNNIPTLKNNKMNLCLKLKSGKTGLSYYEGLPLSSILCTQSKLNMAITQWMGTAYQTQSIPRNWIRILLDVSNKKEKTATRCDGEEQINSWLHICFYCQKSFHTFRFDLL